MSRIIYLIPFLALIFLMGNTECRVPPETSGEQTPPADPAKVAEGFKMGFENAIYTIESAEAWATLNEEPSFHPCMVADASTDVLVITGNWVDPIYQESMFPDGHLVLEGGFIDVERCFSLSDVPEIWPPTEVDPQVIVIMQSAVPGALGMVKLIIISNQEHEGPTCIQAEIWKGILGDDTQGLESLITDSVVSIASGAEQVWVPGVSIDYEGCGLEFDDVAGTTVIWGGPESD
tara:strand:+ start:194 stop:895 length:702 start_codon:yes stop_codon:yes gene_type:complete